MFIATLPRPPLRHLNHRRRLDDLLDPSRSFHIGSCCQLRSFRLQSLRSSPERPPLPIHPFIPRVEPSPPPRCPLGRLPAHIILRAKLPTPVQTLEELPVIDQRMPLALHQEPRTREQHAATMRMLRRDAVVQPAPPQRYIERFHKGDDLGVERHILHRQPRGRGRRGPAVRDALDLDEAR